MSHSAQSLSQVLADVIVRYGYQDGIDAARAVEDWPAVAGPAIAKVTDQVWLKDGVLNVKLNSAAWRHQLQFQREAWRDRMNEHLGRVVVDEVAFR